jgi:Exocyst complex component Sec5
LEIVTADDFDLRHVEKSQAEYMEQALHEVQTEMQKAEAMNATDELRAKVTAQKESLEALIDRMGGIEAMENIENLKYSVLPTSPKFDPILFLTLVHRSDNYDTLVGSLDRLSSKFFFFNVLWDASGKRLRESRCMIHSPHPHVPLLLLFCCSC